MTQEQPVYGDVPGRNQGRLLQPEDAVEEDVLEPSGAIGDVDNVKEENKGDDNIVDQFLNWAAHTVDRATEVRSHGENPGQHQEVVQTNEQEELFEEDSEEDAEDKHSAAEDEEAPEPLGGVC